MFGRHELRQLGIPCLFRKPVLVSCHSTGRLRWYLPWHSVWVFGRSKHIDRQSDERALASSRRRMARNGNHDLVLSVQASQS